VWRAPVRCGRRPWVLLPLLACCSPAGHSVAGGARAHDPDGGWKLSAQLFALLWLGVAAISLASAIVSAALGALKGRPLERRRRRRRFPLRALACSEDAAARRGCAAAAPLAALRSQGCATSTSGGGTLLFLFDPDWLPRCERDARGLLRRYCGLCTA